MKSNVWRPVLRKISRCVKKRKKESGHWWINRIRGKESGGYTQVRGAASRYHPAHALKTQSLCRKGNNLYFYVEVDIFRTLTVCLKGWIVKLGLYTRSLFETTESPKGFDSSRCVCCFGLAAPAGREDWQGCVFFVCFFPLGVARRSSRHIFPCRTNDLFPLECQKTVLTWKWTASRRSPSFYGKCMFVSITTFCGARKQ